MIRYYSIEELGSRAGWYFSDEAEQLRGPYETQAIAEKKLQGYLRCLEEPSFGERLLTAFEEDDEDLE